MKVTIEHMLEQMENEVIIRCHVIDESVNKLLHFLESQDPKLLGTIDKTMHILDPEKIFYIESENKKVFIYGEQKAYQSRKRLYELEEELASHNFFRASKWMILNFNKIVSVRPLFDGRLEALLKNSKKVFISRKFVPVLKEKLEIQKGDKNDS